MARVIITIPDEFLKEIDQVAREEHRNRSELIREAFRAYKTRDTKGPVGRNRAAVANALAAQARASEKLKGSGWNGVAEVRKWRGEV